jgi:hypothetical protein
MSSNVAQQTDVVALLSIASTTESSETSTFAQIAGKPMLEWQMLALQRAGVRRFLIEVDSVPGALLDLADAFRHDGADVQFVRNIKDVQGLLLPQTSLAIVAEAHHFSGDFVSEMMGLKPPFVATVDSRDDNAAFERIDLNTRWAGFAILQSAIVQSIGELPEGWSIGSSLLRHAVQSGSQFVPVLQGRVQQGDVMRMDNRSDASTLADNILNMRVNTATGYIERRIFGPVGKYLAPLVWRNSSARPMVHVSALVTAVTSFGFSAATAALFAMMLERMTDVIGDEGFGPKTRQWHKRVFWLLLVAAASTVAWRSAGQPVDALWYTLIALLLAYYSQNAVLPRWSAALLKSPALVCLGLLAGAIFSTFETSARFIGLAQLALLIASQRYSGVRVQNNIQA